MTTLPPAIDFPSPPAPFGVEYVEESHTIIIPAELWIQIAEYYIEVKATEEKYKAIRAEYSE